MSETTDRFEFDTTLKRLLLVGGLSCSGKTTFIRALSQRAVPEQVLSALPEDAPEWPLVWGKKKGWAAPARPESATGQIVHCDLTSFYYPEMRKLRAREGTFGDDDAIFKRWLAAADEIFAVIIRTPQHQLLRHLSLRSMLIHFPVFARVFAARYVVQLVNLERAIPDWIPAMARKFGPRWRARAIARDGYALLAKEYGRSSDLDTVPQDWADWLLKTAGPRVEAILHIEPVLTSDGKKSFRLFASGDSDLARRSLTISAALIQLLPAFC